MFSGKAPESIGNPALSRFEKYAAKASSPDVLFSGFSGIP
jgi:hypothetical protein